MIYLNLFSETHIDWLDANPWLALAILLSAGLSVIMFGALVLAGRADGMTRVSEAEFGEILRNNPDIAGPVVEERPEPERARRYRAEHGVKARVPTEAQEQRAVMKWAAMMVGKWPELHLLHHIPNGGERVGKEGALLAAEGVRAGVPDLHLPVPRHDFAGLWIEMKRADHSNSPTPEQKWWIDSLRATGHLVEVCYGATEAIRVITEYLGEVSA